MNRHHHRLVFNAARGCLMAVAETARCAVKAASGSRAGRRLVLAAAAGPGLWLLAMVGVQAQIVADPTAPGQQRPTVLSAPNGVPLVNIQTPSAAGVSRNVYRQFDVQGNGAILNNSRGNAQTQTGGWVQGNPWLAKGEARVILNEVNSSDPSQLRGALEVAGGRAEVIVANPAGIQVDGARFINASRVTLTTGSPVVNGGSLDGYRVQRGTVRIDGAGLDASLTDHAAILARAVQVNAGVWAQQLQVVSGANEVSADLARVSPSQAQGEAPRFALDVAQLGGMYAGQIHLIGTEAGVGVNLAGSVGATAADLIIDTSGWLSSTGRLQAQGQLHVSAAGDLAHSGQMTSAQAMQLSTQGVLHNSGQVDSMQGLEVQAQAGVVNGGRMASRDRLRVQTPAGLRNSGELVAGGELVLRADTIGNQNGLASGHLGFVGQWATLEPVPDQAFARNALAISTAFKGDVGFVVELEIVKPTAAQVGLVGPLGAAPGGALQVRFAFEQRQGAAHFRLLSRRALP